MNWLPHLMYISKPQSSSVDFPSLAEKRYIERCVDQLGTGYRPRSHSWNDYEQCRAKSRVERTKHAFKFKLNEPFGFDSYKGNIRGNYMQASFTTLEDLFVKLPGSVRFDVGIRERFAWRHPKRKRLKTLTLFPSRQPYNL